MCGNRSQKLELSNTSISTRRMLEIPSMQQIERVVSSWYVGAEKLPPPLHQANSDIRNISSMITEF